MVVFVYIKEEVTDWETHNYRQTDTYMFVFVYKWTQVSSGS